LAKEELTPKTLKLLQVQETTIVELLAVRPTADLEKSLD